MQWFPVSQVEDRMASVEFELGIFHPFSCNSEFFSLIYHTQLQLGMQLAALLSHSCWFLSSHYYALISLSYQVFYIRWEPMGSATVLEGVSALLLYSSLWHIGRSMFREVEELTWDSKDTADVTHPAWADFSRLPCTPHQAAPPSTRFAQESLGRISAHRTVKYIQSILNNKF